MQRTSHVLLLQFPMAQTCFLLMKQGFWKDKTAVAVNHRLVLCVFLLSRKHNKQLLCCCCYLATIYHIDLMIITRKLSLLLFTHRESLHIAIMENSVRLPYLPFHSLDKSLRKKQKGLCVDGSLLSAIHTGRNAPKKIFHACRKLAGQGKT